MPACTGLPPGELMRSTTALARRSSKALLQRGDQRFGARFGVGAISPLISTTAVCGRSAHSMSARCASSAQDDDQHQAARPGGRRCASGARCGARARMRARPFPARLKAAGRGRGGSRRSARRHRWHRWPSSSADSSWRSRGRCVERRRPYVALEGYQYTRPSVRSTSSRGEPAAPHGPPTHRPVGRLVGRTVRRAEDAIAGVVEKIVGLPVHLHRHVDAAVQVGNHPALEAQREGAHRLAGTAARRKTSARPIGEVVGGAQATCAGWRSQAQACCSSQSCSSADRMRDEQRRTAMEGIARYARRSSRPTLAPPAFSASCRSCVVSPTISVRAGSAPSSSHQLQQHRRMRLADAVSSAVREASNKPRSCGAVQRLVEPAPRSCRWPPPAGGRAPSAPASIGSRPSNSTTSSWCAQVVVAIAPPSSGTFRAAGRAPHGQRFRAGPGR